MATSSSAAASASTARRRPRRRAGSSTGSPDSPSACCSRRSPCARRRRTRGRRWCGRGRASIPAAITSCCALHGRPRRRLRRYPHPPRPPPRMRRPPPRPARARRPLAPRQLQRADGRVRVRADARGRGVRAAAAAGVRARRRRRRDAQPLVARVERVLAGDALGDEQRPGQAAVVAAVPVGGRRAVRVRGAGGAALLAARVAAAGAVAEDDPAARDALDAARCLRADGAERGRAVGGGRAAALVARAGRRVAQGRAAHPRAGAAAARHRVRGNVRQAARLAADAPQRLRRRRARWRGAAAGRDAPGGGGAPIGRRGVPGELPWRRLVRRD